MKFYEFNKFEYYALILASSEEDALEGYNEILADLEEEKSKLKPDVITEEQALKRYKKSVIENCETEEEKEEDFCICIKSFKYREEEAIKRGIELSEKYQILLIDGSLL